MRLNVLAGAALTAHAIGRLECLATVKEVDLGLVADYHDRVREGLQQQPQVCEGERSRTRRSDNSKIERA